MKGLLLTYLLAYGGALVALFNPFVGVCIYWLFDIVRPQFMFAWAGTQGSFSEVIAIATILGWALKGFGTWQFGRGRAVVLLFVAFACFALLSAATAPDQQVAIAFVRELLKRVVMFVIAITLADSIPRLKALAWVIAGSAGYLSLELNLRYLAGVNEAQQFGYGGMDNNSLAISLVTCFGPALFLGLYVRPVWQKGLAFASAALIGHTVLLTFSRGGILGLLLAGIAAIVVIPKRPRYMFVVAIALVVGLRLAGPELRDRFSTAFTASGERDSSAQSRVDLWADCLKVVAAYPFLGAGPDHFPLVAADFGWPEGKEAHSLWLQVAAEIGLPGVLAFLFVFVVAGLKMWRFARKKPASDGELWAQTAACMVVTSLVGFVVSAQFVTLEGLETPLYVVVLAVGTLRINSLTAPVASPQASRVAAVRPAGFPALPTIDAGLARRSVMDRRTGA